MPFRQGQLEPTFQAIERAIGIPSHLLEIEHNALMISAMAFHGQGTLQPHQQAMVTRPTMAGTELLSHLQGVAQHQHMPGV